MQALGEHLTDFGAAGILGVDPLDHDLADE